MRRWLVGAGAGGGGPVSARAVVERRFDGKVAFVTGAASGIGRAVCTRLAAEGASVAGVDVDGDGAAATAEKIAADGGRAWGSVCNVGDEASVRAAVEATVGELGPPSVVCNVAGIARFGNSVDVPLAEWEQVLRVNLTGVFIVCQATLPHLLEHGGNIVNVASTSGLMGQKYAAAYCASKGGVVLLTKALATEYVGRGVRVNAVAPGGIDTPITQNFAMPEGARMKDFERIMSPLGFAQPEDVAGLVAYLASDDAWYVTGSINTIDGGITA